MLIFLKYIHHLHRNIKMNVLEKFTVAFFKIQIITLAS